ncbi:placenta-specific gene 8 protein-like [Biomphalaria glabrata]|uniref:Placenta-specific gene 8 protein-like n=1 Tax=Biomphalaria glabrata TaxID=6526 RepID=A0A9W2ZBP8_BIOGL|nr:placenta-specific gene 8 protein-like [Biomphalaria glabrata]XP_055872379.1 placenta-specific gene 8 protein-like [Biomphalaria glabrata]
MASVGFEKRGQGHDVPTITQPGMVPPPQYAPYPGPQQAPWPQQVGPSQQMNTTTNIVITGQPASSGQPVQRDWSSGLCDCFTDMGSCCLAWCCPCCLQCGLAQDMGESCCEACLYNWCNPGALFGMRVYIRAKENIRGSLCNDFNLTGGCCSCCYCCALAQLAREVKYIKSTKGYV